MRNPAFAKLTDKELMTLTIYGEARGEKTPGRIAVGTVILERVDHRNWDGKTIREVCLMKYQFSCYLENDPNYGKLLNIAEHWDESIIIDHALQECFDIAAGLIDKTIPRTPIVNEKSICQYVEKQYRLQIDKQAVVLSGKERIKFDEKRWWIRMQLATTIGNHEFYA